jgi:hypothetical protein
MRKGWKLLKYFTLSNQYCHIYHLTFHWDQKKEKKKKMFSPQKNIVTQRTSSLSMACKALSEGGQNKSSKMKSVRKFKLKLKSNKLNKNIIGRHFLEFVVDLLNLELNLIFCLKFCLNSELLFSNCNFSHFSIFEQILSSKLLSDYCSIENPIKNWFGNGRYPVQSDT